MTAADTTHAVDLRSVFFEDPSGAAATMTAALAGEQPGEGIGGALGRMPDAARQAVLDRVGTAAAGLLEQNVTDIVGAAWRKHAALRDAALATLAEPGTVRAPELATHTVSFAHEPAVEIRLGETLVATVTLQIQVEMQIKCLTATVRRGRLTAIRAGTCELAGTLTLMGRELTRRRMTLDLAASLPLGRGIPLLADDTGEPGTPAAA